MPIFYLWQWRWCNEAKRNRVFYRQEMVVVLISKLIYASVIVCCMLVLKMIDFQCLVAGRESVNCRFWTISAHLFHSYHQDPPGVVTAGAAAEPILMISSFSRYWLACLRKFLSRAALSWCGNSDTFLNLSGFASAPCRPVDANCGRSLKLLLLMTLLKV